MGTEQQVLKIANLLKQLNTVDGLAELFCQVLNYEYRGEVVSYRHWKQNITEHIKELKRIASCGDFHIIFCRMPRLLKGEERRIVNQILREQPYSLVIFSDQDLSDWHFVNVKYEREGKSRQLLRRLVIDSDSKRYGRLRTASERITLLYADEGIKPLELQMKHDEAFDVEKVTKEFYETYRRLLGLDSGSKQAKEGLVWDIQRRHDCSYKEAFGFAQLLMNRMMFLYFVQKKNWLAEKGDFLYDLFKNRYLKSNAKKDSFYHNWLSPLFFGAFNKKFNPKEYSLPQDVIKDYQNMPYLNGGLFSITEFDEKGFDVSDEFFNRAFNDLLERFNFTISEDTPFEQEVAVDPEMLGKVYESLVLEEERHQSGIFYTPRVEVDFMCRISLVEYLRNFTGIPKEEIIRFIFTCGKPDEEVPDLSPDTLRIIRDSLAQIKVCDPACGSGAFLVGMMRILTDIFAEIAKKLREDFDLFKCKKEIIGNSLYGVDIKLWAVRVAELRLWLSLIVDADKNQVNIYDAPLLPNFTYHLRQGDSLIEEVAGIPLCLRRQKNAFISPSIKRIIKDLMDLKDDHYNNRYETYGSRQRLEEKIINKEQQLWQSAVKARTDSIEAEILSLQNQLRVKQREMLTLTQEQKDIFEQEREKKLERVKELEREKEKLQKLPNEIQVEGEKGHFLWEIEFAEVFTSERDGFDIVLGNPPYVRQEEIQPPLDEREKVPVEEKQFYKERLEKSLQTLYGSDLKIDKKSDLYIYFYIPGMSLLRRNGVFTFITSNSWLDVNYGTTLQKFLLTKEAQMKAIYDNPKRSFAASDVNTIIAVFKRPLNETREPVKFVAFLKPFEEVLKPETLISIEKVSERTTTSDYRVVPKTYPELVAEGSETSDEEGELKGGVKTYIGNKWGGKYLRAPDIYWTILEKGKGKLVRLGDIAEVRFGIKTGCNDFFYLEPTGEPAPKGFVSVRNGAGWEGLIEEEFLKPVLTSMQEVDSCIVDISGLKKRLFVCNATKKHMKDMTKEALKYIQWGESQVTKKGAKHTKEGIRLPEVASLCGRGLWYSIECQEACDVVIPRIIRQRFFSPVNLPKV
ncbi:MAG: BREX-1 system adenine-specific DNA-methyltransferase PglX, partial [Planctomycetota bacterium]|nr:BREX-1 system adenine-specific DNA-methyltransferase PglX [Planctomycetota bacterium]